MNPNHKKKISLILEKFIYIKLPGNIGPLDRGELFEDQIDPMLEKEGLGSVSGGSSLGDEQPDGSRQVAFCGIDVDVITVAGQERYFVICSPSSMRR